MDQYFYEHPFILAQFRAVHHSSLMPQQMNRSIGLNHMNRLMLLFTLLNGVLFCMLLKAVALQLRVLMILASASGAST